MHRYYLHNEAIRETSEVAVSAGQVGFLTGWGVFTTIRVHDGVMFEWPRHWQRISRDAERMRVPPPRSEWLEERLYQLIDANRASEATLRVNIIRNRGGLFEGPAVGRDSDVVAFTTDVVKWPESVRLGVVEHGRHAGSEFAGTKYISWSENLTRYERAHEEGLDEVILLNERGEISECTSANVFVVENGKVWTPPLDSGCLLGVTRAVLLEEIAVSGIAIAEKMLRPEDLEDADEVFITSTTRELLPVSEIRGLRIRGGRAITDRLARAFREYVTSYVKKHRRSAAIQH